MWHNEDSSKRQIYQDPGFSPQLRKKEPKKKKEREREIYSTKCRHTKTGAISF